MKTSSFAASSLILLASSSLSASGISVADVATGLDPLSTLVKLVVNADLLPAIDGTSNTNITVFAPINDAFEALDPSLALSLQAPEWGAHLASVLGIHLIGTTIPSTSITEPTILTTLSGESVSVTTDPIAVEGATVIGPDIAAENGVVHVVDRVITPSWIETELFLAVAADESLSTLSSLLEVAGLEELLSEQGPFTLFAPTDEAFGALDTATTECLVGNPDWLAETLMYHVLANNALVPSSLVSTGIAATMQGDDLSIDASVLGVNDGTATIVSPDAVLASNGIAHLVDAVLVPESILEDLQTCVGETSGSADDKQATEVESSSPKLHVASFAGFLMLLSGLASLLA